MSLGEVFQSISYAAQYAPAIPLVIAVFFRRHLSRAQIWLAGAILFSGIIEICSTYYKNYYGTNLPLYHLYVIGEFGFLTLVFGHIYHKPIPRNLLIPNLLIFLLLAILNIIFFQPLNVYATYTRTLESIILLSFSIRFFYLVLRELKIKRLEASFSFWFSTAILVYFSANLLLFIYSNFILSEEPAETFYTVWAMHGILNILLYLFYALALWQKE